MRRWNPYHVVQLARLGTSVDSTGSIPLCKHQSSLRVTLRLMARGDSSWSRHRAESRRELDFQYTACLVADVQAWGLSSLQSNRLLVWCYTL